MELVSCPLLEPRILILSYNYGNLCAPFPTRSISEYYDQYTVQ